MRACSGTGSVQAPKIGLDVQREIVKVHCVDDTAISLYRMRSRGCGGEGRLCGASRRRTFIPSFSATFRRWGSNNYFFDVVLSRGAISNTS